MLEILQNFLNPQGFVAHGHCYLWQSELVWLHVIGDGAIALAYFSIPLTLVYFVSQRKEIPFNWIFWMFGSFIIACGIGHVMDIWNNLASNLLGSRSDQSVYRPHLRHHGCRTHPVSTQSFSAP